MIITCGIYLYSNLLNKILVCHPTNSPWNNWSIPKGLKNDKEDLFEAASRELTEETGISLKELNSLYIYNLPPVKYQKQDKVLESFLVITDTDLNNHHFICDSLVDDKIPEVDQWKWISFDDKDTLHESQQNNLILIKKLLHKKIL